MERVNQSNSYVRQTGYRRDRINIHGENTDGNKEQGAVRRVNQLICILHAQNGDEDIKWLHKVDVVREVGHSIREPS